MSPYQSPFVSNILFFLSNLCLMHKCLDIFGFPFLHFFPLWRFPTALDIIVHSIVFIDGAVLSQGSSTGRCYLRIAITFVTET